MILDFKSSVYIWFNIRLTLELMSNRSLISLISTCALLLACIPSFYNNDWAKFMAVFSNVAFVLPIMVSYYNRTSQIILLIVMIVLISTLYHTCKSYDVCAILTEEHWMYLDVTYSWFTLLSLCSLLALGKYFWELSPLNAVIVIFSHEANCGTSNFECRSFKMSVVVVYLLAAIFIGFRFKKQFDIIDSVLTIVSFIIACSIYLFGNNIANHAIWHIFGALGFSFALTMHKPSLFHSMGFRKGDVTTDEVYEGMEGAFSMLFPIKYRRIVNEENADRRVDL
tara:strand:- start:7128 stop:7973 length:846 start_codon:yes stop_codon:yes gene_type:complete